MPKHPNTLKLHALMERYGVDGPFVSNMLDRSLKTIHCWRSQSPAPISDDMLALLEYRLIEHFANKGPIGSAAESYLDDRADYLFTYVGDTEMLRCSAAAMLGAVRVLSELDILSGRAAARFTSAALDALTESRQRLPRDFIAAFAGPTAIR